MKLKPFTDEETNDLLSSIEDTVNIGIEINKKAVELLNKKYNEYLENFKISLFRWYPMNFENFLTEITSTSRIIVVDNNWYWDKSPLKELIPLNSKLYKSTFYFMTENSKLHFLKKYNVEPLNDNEFMLLKNASIFTYFAQDYDFNEKYKILIKYADKPFHFDENDIKWLEDYEIVKNSVSKYKDNL